MQRKYPIFFIYSYSLKKGKREGQCIQSSLKGYKEKRLFKRHQFIPGVKMNSNARLHMRDLNTY